MPIISRTFVTTIGSTYVDDASFGGATFYGVKRSGFALTRITTGVPVNEQFLVVGTKIFIAPTNPFNAGEKIWVLYTGAQVVPPPYCTPPSTSTASDALPPALAGVAYLYVIPLLGTAPFVLSSIVKPTWMTVAVSGSDLNFTGTPGFPDVGTGFPVTFTITNCSGASTYAFVSTIDVLTPAGNGTFIVVNSVTTPSNYVKNIFPNPPYFYTLTSGSLPLNSGQTASGFMILAVTSAVSVFVLCTTVLNYLELYKNGVLVGSVMTPISGIYAFSLTTFAITDNMEIKFKNTV